MNSLARIMRGEQHHHGHDTSAEENQDECAQKLGDEFCPQRWFRVHSFSRAENGTVHRAVVYQAQSERGQFSNPRGNPVDFEKLRKYPGTALDIWGKVRKIAT